MSTIDAPPLKRIAISQLFSLVVLVALVSVFDVVVAISVLIGGVVHVVPQAWFARMAFRYSGARQTHKILNAMYKGQAGKLLITATMFAVVFVFVQPLHVPALFAGYVAMIIVYVCSAARVLQANNNK